MKLKIFIILLGAFVTIGLSGCYKDINDPGDPLAPPAAVSFSGELLPIFTANCATAGCHDAVPSHKPSITAENAYKSLKNGVFIDPFVPANSIIYSVVKSGEMPPSGPLKATKVKMILDWIRNGAPNN